MCMLVYKKLKTKYSTVYNIVLIILNIYIRHVVKFVYSYNISKQN